MPPGIHAGGLRYHAMAPLISHVYDARPDRGRGRAADHGLRGGAAVRADEGIVPAPESAHAIRAAIDEALKAKEEGESKNILFNLTGHGLLDLGAYDAYLSGELEDYDYPGRGDRRVDREAAEGRIGSSEAIVGCAQGTLGKNGSRSTRGRRGEAPPPFARYGRRGRGRRRRIGVGRLDPDAGPLRSSARAGVRAAAGRGCGESPAAAPSW